MAQSLTNVAKRALTEEQTRCAVSMEHLLEISNYKRFSKAYLEKVRKTLLKEHKVVYVLHQGFMILERKKTAKLKKVSSKVLAKAVKNASAE